MSGIFKITEAASLALHTVALLASRPKQLTSTRQIAGILDISENHLSKVLQQLHRVGMVESVRGPGGGFRLAKPADEITLLEVYEHIEGPLDTSHCLLEACQAERCLLGNLLANLNRKVRDYFENTKISQLSGFVEKQFLKA